MKTGSALAIAILVALSGMVRPAAGSPTSPCPYYVDAIGPSATASVSGIVLGSNSGNSAAVSIVLYTRTASYILNTQVPGFGEAYYRTGTFKGSTYRYPISGYLSAPILFGTPDDQPIEAAYVQPATWAPNSTACSAQRYIASDTDSISQALPELQRITTAQLAATNSPAKLVFRASEDAPTCPVPYAATRVLRAAYPAYPPDFDGTRAVGVAVVSVLLDESGHVIGAAVFESSMSAALDRASVRAASASIYSGAIFRCRPANGAYRFRSEFTAQ